MDFQEMTSHLRHEIEQRRTSHERKFLAYDRIAKMFEAVLAAIDTAESGSPVLGSRALDVNGPLTEKQKAIFALLEEDVDRAKIARELDIEPKTLDAHLQNIRKHFGFKTMRELKHFALERKRNAAISKMPKS